MENTSAVSGRRDMFLDERGTGLRVTWHPERDLVVLSVWQGDGCVGTFRMSVQDIPRLSGLLAAALGDWVDQTGGVPAPGGPDPGGPDPGGPGPGGPRPGGQDPGGPGLAGPRPGGPGRVGAGPGRPGPGGVGSALGTGGAQGPRLTGDWDVGTPAGTSPGTAGGSGAGLSVQRRIRLSRTVLKLRGMQHRRRQGG